MQDGEEPAFADIDVHGAHHGQRAADADGADRSQRETPTFDVDLSLEGAKLVDVNPWLREFLKVDAEMRRVLDVRGARGRRRPIRRLRAADPRGPRVLQLPTRTAKGRSARRGKAIVNLAAKILENKQEDQVATQIPLRGELENPDAGHRDGDRQSRAQRIRRRVRALARGLDHACATSRATCACLSGEPPADEQPDQERIAPGAPARSLLSPLIALLAEVVPAGT